MDHHGQRQAWREVGAFTRRLHAVRGPHFGPPAWGTAFERWSDLLAADIEGFIDDADRLGLPQAPFVRLRGAVARLASVLDEGTEPRLVHSDLWASHLFIEQGEAGPCLAGVIDLDFGRYADPLAEHLLPSFALHNVPGPMQASFLEGYGPWQPPAGLEVRILVYRALGLAWDVTLRAFQDQETQTSTEDLIDVVEELEMTEPGAGLPAPG
jgi:aminoglycoside phosphotransferase (APT) family kinase protein